MNTIACIIVTYNRLELLKRCVESIRNQTKSDFDIFVINNGSTDGTKEWLEHQSDLTAITQENLGGAGGFYTGMKTAYDKGYEWIWMMDDDGVADKDQLVELFKHSTEQGFVFSNALVQNIDRNDLLAFGLLEGQQTIRQTADAKKHTYIDYINPFNGTFINRKLVDRIGYIKKEMFIWGDEKEYGLRALKSGIQPKTITTAIHNHPSIKSTYANVFPFISTIMVQLKPHHFSHYYYRNLGYIYSTYYKNRVYRPFFAYSIYFIFRLQFKELFKFVEYYTAGIKKLYKQNKC